MKQIEKEMRMKKIKVAAMISIALLILLLLPWSSIGGLVNSVGVAPIVSTLFALLNFTAISMVIINKTRARRKKMKERAKN